ncbi:MAG: rhomboid family intramembrane serine protease [Oscillospiraceae bacterium]|nr:rhomboid family intramembrane serine protease [Oscillospiraceae bacterium]
MLKLKKISYNSPVILTFTFISLAALILNTLTGGVTNALLFSVYRAPLTDPLFYPRLFLHVLGHSGLSHFVGNFTIILLIGPMLEEKYGWKLLLILIAVTAFITGLVNVLFFSTGLLGASGVAFMLIILSSFANSDQDTIPLTFILVALVYIGGEILNGLFTRDDIAQFAHIIGGVCGGAAGLVYSGTNIGKKRR